MRVLVRARLRKRPDSLTAPHVPRGARVVHPSAARGVVMNNILWAVAALLLIMWLLGLTLNFTLGGLIHVLLVLAIVAVLVRIITGRKAV